MEQALHRKGVRTYILDGDNIRRGLNADLGFSLADRAENIRRVGEVAKLMTDAGLIVLTAFISPFRADRHLVRDMMGEGEFIEIHVDTPLEVAEARDVKGLYKKARAGEIANFTGLDAPYEAPQRPEVHLETVNLSIDEAAEHVVTRLRGRHGDRLYGGPDNDELHGSTGDDVIPILVSGTTYRYLITDKDPTNDIGVCANGDIVVSFGGRGVESRRQLQFLIAGASPGQDVDLEFIRDGKRLSGRVRPVEWIEEEPGTAPSGGDAWLGMEVASIASGDPRVVRLKEALGVTAATGVMVVAVQEDQPAADAGIRPGDVIVSVEGQDVEDLEDWSRVETLYGAGRRPLTVLVRTGATENYLTVQPRGGGVEN